MKVFFYPHNYLRDRHLDIVRHWPHEEIVNLEMLNQRKGAQVSRSKALQSTIGRSWKQVVPLLNIKRRPPDLSSDTVVYVWGSVMASGKYISDLDNPYSLVGYNLRAMPLWRPVIRRFLLSARCIEVRCMSEACKRTLHHLFGEEVAAKAVVCYPYIEQQVLSVDAVEKDGPRFLFVGTQFDIKGGQALLRAWPRVVTAIPGARLDVVTHLPNHHKALINVSGLTIHEAKFSRDEIWQKFLRKSDVLILPTYMESFGMVALEALAHGLALVVTDVYALAEIVENGINGFLLSPPLSVWDGFLPSVFHYQADSLFEIARSTDTSEFEHNLVRAMIETGRDKSRLLAMRRASLRLFENQFASTIPGVSC